jgi:hypothetical protein
MKKYLPIFVLLGCTAAFVFGVVQLFALRFEAGDVYPPYSSLRADPLGTEAFYESLGKMSDVTVRRDYSMSDRLPEEPGTAYLHLAAEPGEWAWLPTESFQEIKNFLARGGRLVITYFPLTAAAHRYYPDDEDQTNSVKSAGLKSKEKKNPSDQPVVKEKKSSDKKNWAQLEDEWGFHEGFKELEQDGDVYEPVTVSNTTHPELPSALDWHSGMIFTNCAAAWHVIYARGTNAVVIERKFGQGSVVLASDSYFLSNEAMLKDRQAKLLAWLIGANGRVVFDEAHFGIVESPGVAALMRKYRLHGLAAGLLLLAGLFIWKNSTSLVPPPPEIEREDFVAGKDAASGFVNLLRRNLAPRELLATCFAEWKKSAAPDGKISSLRQQRAEAIFQAESVRPVREQNPIAAYRQISETLVHRKSKP